jgi:hypothetical protein
LPFKKLSISFPQYLLIFFHVHHQEEWLMIRTQISRVLWFCFSIIFFRSDVVFASLLEGTLVATAHGLVPIQNLKVGDKVLGYDLNAPSYDEALCEVAVTKINKHITDTLFTVCTKNGWVEASPHQLIFTFIPEDSQNGDACVMDFVRAQDITKSCMLIDAHMNCLDIVETNKLKLSCSYPEQYVEKVKRNRHKKVTGVVRLIVNADVYALEVEAPHVFLIAENPHATDMSKTRLLLTHNGIPVLLPITYHLASSSALTFPSILGGLSVVGGPVALALGITGLGYFGYKLFKSHSNNKQPSFYIERAGTSSPGGMDPKEPKDPKKENSGKNGSRASIFEKKICKLPPGERVAAIRTEAETVANERGWTKAKTTSKINKRIVYMDESTNRLYSLDTQHGRFEMCNEKGIHLGEVDFDLNLTKAPDLSGGHNLQMS